MQFRAIAGICAECCTKIVRPGEPDLEARKPRRGDSASIVLGLQPFPDASGRLPRVSGGPGSNFVIARYRPDSGGRASTTSVARWPDVRDSSRNDAALPPHDCAEHCRALLSRPHWSQPSNTPFRLRPGQVTACATVRPHGERQPAPVGNSFGASESAGYRALNTLQLQGHAMRLRTLIYLAALAGCATLSARNAQAQSPPRGYSIPLVDLADQTDRQVIVDREAGQYLGHPTTVLLEDGRTMIVVYPKGHGRGPIVMKRSTDGGLTWSQRLPVPENWSTSLEVPTIYRVVDPQDVKRLILFSGLYPIRMAVSDDDGNNWSPLKPICDFGGIVAMSALTRLHSGDYMALFHDDGRFLHAHSKGQKPPVFVVYKTLSKDGGLTWSEPEPIARHPSAYLCEPGIIRSPDGKQLAVLLRENSRKFNSFVIISADEGRTWTEPRGSPALDGRSPRRTLCGRRPAGNHVS